MQTPYGFAYVWEMRDVYITAVQIHVHCTYTFVFFHGEIITNTNNNLYEHYNAQFWWIIFFMLRSEILTYLYAIIFVSLGGHDKIFMPE